jgi:hypothetical protein
MSAAEAARGPGLGRPQVGPARIGRSSIGQSAIGLALVLVLVWISHMFFPGPTSMPTLDASWEQVLGHALTRRWQAGRDIVFTFGPLGYFNPAPYDPALFWVKIAGWEIALKAVLTAYLVYAVPRMRSTLEKTVFVLALLFLFPGHDAFFFLASVAIALDVLRANGPLRARDALGFVCLTLISLVKFTYFVLIAVCIALIAVQRAWSISRRAGARALALYAVVFATAWTLLGQSLLWLPRYLLHASWIARGYNEGMAWIGPPRETAIACWALALAAVVLALHVLLQPRSTVAFTSAAMLACGLFVAWKGGLVRHGGNSITFFGFAAIAPFLLTAAPPSCARDHLLAGVQTTARIGCTALAVYGYMLAQGMGADAPMRLASRSFGDTVEHVETLGDLGGLRRRLERDRADQRARFDLPRVRAGIGSAPVDVFFHSQAIALLNDFDYRPRPVFQSYSAYTPELMRLNARYLESPGAPRYMLFAYEFSDNRLASSEDALALQVVMRDYAPVLVERGYLLLERRPEPSRVHVEDERSLAFEGSASFGEAVDLSPWTGAGGTEDRSHGAARPACTVLALDVELTAWGKLWSALVKTPPVYIRFELDDGSIRTLRLVPGLMHTGVVVGPYLDTQGAYIDWWCGKEVPSMRRFSVHSAPGDERVFESRIAVRVYRDEALGARVDPRLEPELAYPMFFERPESVSASPPPLRSRLENVEVLTLQAPSEIAFAVAPGAHALHAEYGVQPNAWENDCSDGAGFSIVARDANGSERTLFRAFVDKNTPGGHQRPHAVDLEFEADRATKLLLRTDGGPSGDTGCDWTYWTEVRIGDRASRGPPR